MELKTPPQKSPEQALAALMRSCARRERAVSDVRNSLTRWKIVGNEADQIIQQLQRERYVDDARYAEAFIRDKLRFSGWGERKIRYALRLKQISPEIISNCSELFESQRDPKQLENILRKKSATIRAKNQYDLRGKLFRFGASRGYDYDELNAVIDRICGETDD